MIAGGGRAEGMASSRRRADGGGTVETGKGAGGMKRMCMASGGPMQFILSTRVCVCVCVCVYGRWTWSSIVIFPQLVA